MSPRVPTAFRPLETTSSFESPVPRRTATVQPSSSASSFLCSDFSSESYAQERLQLLSRLEQRWYPARPNSCNPRSDCVAPVPRKSFTSSSSFGSRPPSSSGTFVDDDAACLELRGIFSCDKLTTPSSRSSSASSTASTFAMSYESDSGLFPLEEIVIPPQTPPMRSMNTMPLNSGFGRAF
ncbi:hypothetical protein LPJ53_000024 [Coemansia erecta]|uniref:Uncharacterized protein n=1 Tax=Coemansia erecta TaxID=147472 RepID=A0A9W7Y7S8_9FUNG|nr:hypothetical protein LPJ53_000024 [Coemansia erecta]